MNILCAFLLIILSGCMVRYLDINNINRNLSQHYAIGFAVGAIVALIILLR